MSIDIETLVQAIRFDVDYHCMETRQTTPLQGSINRELHARLRRAQKKELPMFPPGMRVRVLNSLCERGSLENHALFDEAVDVFKERLNAFNESNSADYVGTDIVIEG